MAKFRMIQEAEVKDYFLPLPEYGKTVSVNKNTWYSDVSKLGMALLKYYSESVVFQGATKTVMETLGENESTLESVLAGGGTGGVDLTPDGLTSTQAKDAIYKAHSIGSSASEIDGVVVKSFLKQNVSFGQTGGKKTHIYRWGSPYGGNDWCFVRTPLNYSKDGNPSKIVILNHGNGWIMKGTESTANFSSKTQFGVDTQNNGAYLDTNRVDFVEYSSPLIEKLLGEGYVVCGAQNDGQNYGAGSAGYGNKETRNNIVYFFEHMINNYNVRNKCSMIAASNGSIATLNAFMLLGRHHVENIVLLYPLLNLYSAWKAQYTSAIAKAYNFSNNENDFTSFKSAVVGHDIFITGTAFSIGVGNSSESDYGANNYLRLYDKEGATKWLKERRLINDSLRTVTDLDITTIDFARRIIMNYPPIKINYSPSDTVVPQKEHSLPFKKIADRSSMEVLLEECSGEHGDYTHFDGIDGNGEDRIISFIKENK